MTMYKTPNEVCKLLSRYDISPTQQRIRVAQVLCSMPRHLSAEQILDEVNQDGMHVSKATIYNTLNLFAERGLVKELIIDPTKVFYDSTTREHYHYFNEDTGELFDVEDENFRIANLPTMPEGLQLSSVDVVIRVRNAPSAQ